MFVNYAMPDIAAFENKVTTDTAIVAPGSRISIEPNRGKIHFAASDRLELDFTLSSDPPRWMELSFMLPSEEWKACRQIFLKYRASGTGIKVRQAIRLGNDSGFHDQFGTEIPRIGDAVAEVGSEFRLTPKAVEATEWMDLKIFFEPTVGRFNLYELFLTGVR